MSAKLQAPLWRKFISSLPPSDARTLVNAVIVHVLKPKVLELIFENSKRIRADALIRDKLAPLPADNCFLEFHSPEGLPDAVVNAFGLLILKQAWPDDLGLNSPIHTHQILVLREDERQPGRPVGNTMALEWGEWENGECGPTASEALVRLHLLESRDNMDFRFRSVPFEPNFKESAPFVGGMLVHACALLAVRGATVVNEVSVKEKRIVRFKGEQAPTQKYRVVDVNIDQIPERYEPGSSEPLGAGRALHHVRGHLRLTEKRGLVMVRPHWRGNAALGIIRKDFNIMRDEEVRDADA